jgi:hypothetical protein
MKNLLILLCLCVGINSGFSQTTKLIGKVTDSIGNPLSMASVIAKEKETLEIDSYSITNEEGLFQLNLPKGKTFILEINFLGFQPLSAETYMPEDLNVIESIYVLQELADELDDVELVYEMPVTIRGDTISYDADSFARGNERKLGDIIENLPGMKLDDDGSIEVEGKKVQKVMVNGKDFFDGDSKLATKNIPADAVSKVEVLRNYNEVDQMRGLGNDQENVAINIKLKEGKENFWFGELNAGIGYGEETRYLANPKLFYYSPDYSINIITNFNNTGDTPFTFRDYFNFTGGFRNFNSGGGTRFNINDSGLGFLLTQNDRAQNIENEFVAGNFTYKASEKLDISGFALLSGNKTDFQTNNIRQFISSGENEVTETENTQKNQLAMLKLSSVYKPNANFQLDYDVLGKLSDQSEVANQFSQFGTIDNRILEDKANKPFSINQNVNAYYTLSEKDIFSGQAQHLAQEEDPFYNAILDFLPFAGILQANTGQSNFDINQEKIIKTQKLDAKVDYYRVLNKKSNISFNVGTTLSYQNFDSSIFQRLDSGATLNFDQSAEVDGERFPLQNDVTYNFRDLFFGTRYKLITGKFTLTPGLTLHNYDLSTDQLGLETSLNTWKLLPDLNLNLQLKRTETIRFDYAMTAEFTDVNQYAEAFVFNNYNRLFRGNRELENALANSFNLSYFNFNMFNYTNITGRLSYTNRINGIKNDTELVAINQVASPFNISSNFADETFSGSGSYSKRFRKFQVETSARLGINTFNNQINGEVLESESFTQNYKASLRSNFKTWPNLEIGYDFTSNRYDNGSFISTFFTDQPFINLEANFLKEFTFTADYNYFNYRSKDDRVSNEYAFLSADLFYQKKDSKWEFILQGMNLLDVQSINQDSFNESFNTTSEYFVMPRMLILKVRYEL